MRTWIGAIVLVAVVSTDATGQVTKFPIATSPLQLSGEVRSNQYVGVVGRQAAWLGTETGGAELWVHPLKLANDFTLDFRIPDYVDPVRGRDVARRVEVRPELTTITYTHATFTVRQHILTPLHEPGILVLLDVDTFRPLEIVGSFKTVFQYAWPGAFGGQYTVWDDTRKWFILSESLQERNALIGSPWAANASSHPAHALPDAPSTFVIPVDPNRIADEFIPIVVAGGIMPRDSVASVYEDLIANAAELYRERVDHAYDLRINKTSIDTPDDELDLAFEWSKVNLDEQVVCNPDLGCGLVAGWGPSGQSARPGFGWFFGGDAAITSFAMDATGQWDAVAQELRFLASFQRDDGKITHEISQAAARIPWFTDYPYGYYHADTTPYWVVAVWKYWKASGDDDLVRELWPAITRAFEWGLTVETDGDGIIENTTGGLAAIEVGAIGDRIHQDIYLAAVWLKSLEAVTELSDVQGVASLATAAREQYERGRATLNGRYWRPDEGYHAFGILQSGNTNDNLTVWPATAAAFGLLDSARAVGTLRALATDQISSDWGARMLSNASPLYGPLEYNSGAVWPFVTGYVSWGQYEYRRPWAGFQHVQALKQMAFDWARGRHPELLSGDYYRPLDTSVPHQFFATAGLTSPVVYGLFGWQPDASTGAATLRPQLPAHWTSASIRNLRVGAATVRADIVQHAFSTSVTIDADGAVELIVAPAAPPGATNQTGARTYRGGSPAQTLRFSWDGGLRVVPPASSLVPGQRSVGLRIIDFTYDGGEWQLDLEGLGGRTYDVQLIGEMFETDDAAGIDGQPGAIRVSFGGSGRVRKLVTLRRPAE